MDLALSLSELTARPMDFSPRQQFKTLSQLYNTQLYNTQPFSTQPNSPPPSYTMAAPFNNQSIMSNPPDHVFDDDDEEDYPEPLSKICITIKAPLLISGNNNAVSVDPASTASKVAVAIVSGLRQMSGAAGGVPMIDEHGRPRPIVVDVEAALRIEGSDNIVGDRAIFATINPPAPKASEDGPKKRERDENGAAGEDDNSKRPKTE
jgi:hypothetical protein